MCVARSRCSPRHGSAYVGMTSAAAPSAGHVRLRTSAVNSPENSQQVADWDSFSHVIHGIAFCAALRWINRRTGGACWPLGLCLVLAVGIEAAWEVFENTPFTIERYRKAT